jgi:Domain of unknown function (DUF4034)
MTRNTKQIRRYGFMLLLCFALGGVRAGNLHVPSQGEALELLSGNQFPELDRRYSAIQSAYEEGTISDEDLRAAFRVFYSTDAALDAQYLAWVKHSPNSYVAHLARGIYYKKVGQERRGDKLTGETSDEDLQGMEEAYRLATQELNASLLLDDRPLLPIFT